MHRLDLFMLRGTSGNESYTLTRSAHFEPISTSCNVRTAHFDISSKMLRGRETPTKQALIDSVSEREVGLGRPGGVRVDGYQTGSSVRVCATTTAWVRN